MPECALVFEPRPRIDKPGLGGFIPSTEGDVPPLLFHGFAVSMYRTFNILGLRASLTYSAGVSVSDAKE
jgi:hypothetical protein